MMLGGITCIHDTSMLIVNWLAQIYVAHIINTLVRFFGTELYLIVQIQLDRKWELDTDFNDSQEK